MINVLNLISLWALPALILLVLTVGVIKKVPVYEEFTDGAKDGFKVAINIIPYTLKPTALPRTEYGSKWRIITAVPPKSPPKQTAANIYENP